jgi:hypothetical protein
MLLETLRSHNHVRQIGRIQNQCIKISSISIYNEQSEKEIRKTIPFTVASKKYLGINFTKEVKDPYNENYKSLKKEVKEDFRR